MNQHTDLLDALAHALREQEWRASALCGQTDPDLDLWFPGKGMAGIGRARRICGMCEVSEQCLAYALDHDEKFGIWGGKSREERRRIADSKATAVDAWIAVNAEETAA